jgi:hypothetical protein
MPCHYPAHLAWENKFVFLEFLFLGNGGSIEGKIKIQFFTSFYSLHFEKHVLIKDFEAPRCVLFLEKHY